MKKSKTNRRVNKSVDHGYCHCLSCDLEKGEQYINLKYPANQKALNEEINQRLNDDQIIFDLNMIATYGEVVFANQNDLDRIRIKAYSYLI